MTRRSKHRPGPTEDDPFAVLGLEPGATAADVLAARRRLAKSLHPDVGGDADRMRRVNAATTSALQRIRIADARGAVPDERHRAAAPEQRRSREATWPGGFVNDAASFTIEALPAEAFEALLVVTSWIGEPLVDDPPHALEVMLREPAPCWCRLDLVPDAGATTVGVTLASIEGAPLPHIDLVRDAWVAELNRLDWDDLEAPGRQRPS